MRFLCVWFVLLAFLGCRSGPDEKENRYADLVAADDDGARGRGWIPRFIPESAHDIIERHNVETNEIWLTFRKAEEELGGIADRCEIVEVSEIVWPNHFPEWWPETLRGDDVSADQRLRRCTVPHKMAGVRFRRVGYMALSPSGDEVWYWEPTPPL